MQAASLKRCGGNVDRRASHQNITTTAAGCPQKELRCSSREYMLSAEYILKAIPCKHVLATLPMGHEYKPFMNDTHSRWDHARLQSGLSPLKMMMDASC